jgi:hypothetical protein
LAVEMSFAAGVSAVGWPESAAKGWASSAKSKAATCRSMRWLVVGSLRAMANKPRGENS